MARTKSSEVWLPQIAEAGLSGDMHRLQLIILSATRSLRSSEPKLSRRLGELMAQHATNPDSLRWKTAPPPPTEDGEGMSLVRLADVDGSQPPVLSPILRDAVEQFLAERRDAARLLQEGIAPPSSILLTGAPGTGKTMLARWVANQLGVPLVEQDLATSISSLLGKTGFNLRRTLDYARSTPCVLLLDEFDAIAKRRDDTTELGELKRIVNVLLKELEDWPLQSVLVAATNHPNLLDPAINRRFHLTISLPMPGRAERAEIMARTGGRFAQELPNDFLLACAETLGERSGSDVDRMMQSAIRRHLLQGKPFTESLIHEVIAISDEGSGGQKYGKLIRTLHRVSDDRLTVRDLADIFGKSVSTVQYHLKKKGK